MHAIMSKSVLYSALTATLLCVAGAASASSSQFIAKQYSEALGRGPDVSGWNWAQATFAQNGCSKNTLLTLSKDVFASAEYVSLGYDNVEKVLTVYRAILNREPDPGGFNYWVSYLNNGNSMASMVDFIGQAIDGGEITSAQICASLGYGWSNANAPLTNAVIPAKNDGGIQTLDALQTALQNAQPGSTVYLSQRAVIVTSSQIVVKPGVTLATVGLPRHTQYAKQARIVRNAMFGGVSELDGALVKLGSGAKLDSVWVSGQAQHFDYAANGVNVVLQSGTGTTLARSRIDNSPGWAAVVAHHFNSPCSGMVVLDNLVTGYSNSHHYAGGSDGYTDGISGNCDDVVVSHNSVIDASDVGIIVFAAGPGRVQKSKISNNTVVSAGVPAFGALMLHPMRIANVGPTTSFAGAAITDNLFWAAPDTHFDLGVILGGATWDGDPSIGVGGAATGNSNGGIPTPMRVGLLVDGMLQATVQQNAITRVEPQVSFPDNPMVFQYSCGSGDALADMSTMGHSSFVGTPQPLQDASIHTCIGHPAP